MRVIKPDGTGGRDVVTAPGHYIEPSFSPDGKSIVFRNAGADVDARAALRRRRRHLRRAGRRLGARRGSCARAAREPTFDHTGKRIYRQRRRGRASPCWSASASAIAGSPLPGGDEVVHFQSDNATQIVPSPDGKWVAFAERWHAFVAPFPHTGRPVDLGPDDQQATRSRAISRDAGFNLHWSGDSRRSYWSLGPELFTRDLAQHLHVPRSQPREARRARSEGRADRLHGASPTCRTARSRSSARGSSRWRTSPAPERHAAGVIENGTVVVEGNRITAIGPSGVGARSPPGAKRIDARGKTIMPGIVDVHAHVGGEGGRHPGAIELAARWPTSRSA